ncbi:MAG: hypothetical protein DMF10_00515 [Verrucomicrobia bacterium]|nr:MAG: hypothetical protein DMF10_00515 [Verrucomicrobiota bacterium]
MASMIRREIGGDHICTLTFDRPDSGANIFDAATLDELNEHLAVECARSLPKASRPSIGWLD